MPLPKPEKRTPIQTRKINVSAFRREDGQWDIEGQLIDYAAFDIPNFFNKRIPAGTAIHDMKIRLTLDSNLKIIEIALDMDAHPYEVCPNVLPSFNRLKGKTIGPGWNQKLKNILGGINGCVHIVDLLRPVGTIGFKTIQREAGKENTPKIKQVDYPPHQINTCFALSSDGPIVKERWPDLYTGD